MTWPGGQVFLMQSGFVAEGPAPHSSSFQQTHDMRLAADPDALLGPMQHLWNAGS